MTLVTPQIKTYSKRKREGKPKHLPERHRSRISELQYSEETGFENA